MAVFSMFSGNVFHVFPVVGEWGFLYSSSRKVRMLTMTYEEFRSRPIGRMIKEAQKMDNRFIDSYLVKNLTSKVYGIEGLTLDFIAKSKTKPKPQDIVQKFAIKKATASQTLHRLEKKGLVVFEKDEADGRNKLISITEDGKKANGEFVKAFEQITSILEAGFTKEERESLASLLYRFYLNALKANEEVGK